MTDSEDDIIPLTRVDSGPKRFSKVPEDIEYEIRTVDVKKAGFLYTLKEGNLLPYETELQGKISQFSVLFLLKRLH